MRKEKKGNKGKSAQQKDYTAAQYIEQANVALSEMQLELAEKMFCRALSKAPNDSNIMDALADVYIQLGEMENALPLLIKSTTLAPHENPYKWFFLGQLQCGSDAVESYRIGISALTLLLDSDSGNLEMIKKQISKAHCSIAELFLTDLCYEECAESNCEEQVQAALTIWPQGLDGFQTLASLRLSQNRRSEAVAAMNQVLDRLLHIRKVVHERTVVEEISGVAEPSEFEDVPEMEFCIATAKILIECAAEDAGFATKAMDLVADLLEDDDENIELWYLMGVAALSCSPPDVDAARFNLERAREMMDRLRQDCDEQGEEFPFEEQSVLVQDHLLMLDGHAHPEDGAGGCAMEGEAAADKEEEDEEWSSCDSDEGEALGDRDGAMDQGDI